MYLKSIELKGFKSFPERTRLEFSPGVSVIVGPNGSGKSNITDAVLWALGEQSPGAIRGASMQDVISAGGKGVGRRRTAEVEVTIDNSEGRAATELSEVSIRRSLDRSGDGVYRLNGARCRLVDVVEVLSDTNMGREMHSVISQGRVESIVHSKPRERRLLVEEAAGLGKHRKRRRRAELKLRAARDNLDRALDVEREARARLRPLKRQAQAAELGARIEAEDLELRSRLIAEELRFGQDRARAAEEAAGKARAARAAVEKRLAEVSERRRAAEERFAARDRERTQAWGRLTKLRGEEQLIAVRVSGMSVSCE
jgi:chromosome segregation protein